MTLKTIRSDFIEKIGVITQAEGMPRIAGRVFGMLVFDGTAVSFADLAERLQVSRASISTSVRLLEERGLIKRIAKPGERQDFFQLAPAPYTTMLEGVQRRTRSVRNEIFETLQSLPENHEATERLNAYARFYTSVDTGLAIALTQLHDADPTQAGQHNNAPKDTTHGD